MNVYEDQLLPGNVRPFLRWAGSKRRLLKHLIPFIPTKYEKYYEPFLGGGSMFFFLCPAKAEISDESASLIKIYKAVKKDPESILDYLRPLRPTRSAFDKIKKLVPHSQAELGGNFIFLNKSCWNGLYRVNSDGIFNVPYGSPRTDFIINEDNFRRCAGQLRRRSISIRCQDFEEIGDRVQKGDFVFFDPPYVTSHNMNGFVEWNKRLFCWSDQERLALLTRKLISNGVNVLVTNADHEDVRELYEGLFYSQIIRYSTLAGDRSKRVQTSEAIFVGGPGYAELGLPTSHRKVVSHGKDSQRGANRSG